MHTRICVFLRQQRPDRHAFAIGKYLVLYNVIVSQLKLKARRNGAGTSPDSYYDLLPDRVGEISEDIATLRRVNVLVDRDEMGYLLQIFMQPVQSRPTLFIEIIQRKNARGFGSGNIQALFKALEREQARRGNW